MTQSLASVLAIFRSSLRLVLDMLSKSLTNLFACPDRSGCPETFTAKGRPVPSNKSWYGSISRAAAHFSSVAREGTVRPPSTRDM